MINEKEVRDFVIETARKGMRFSVVMMIVFAVTTVSTILTGVFVPDTYEGAIRILITGLSIGFSIIILLYINQWFHCLSFLKGTKHVHVNDRRLQRLVTMNRCSCILFMIPVIFFVGMNGFYFVKRFAEGKVKRGSLEQILYYIWIDRGISKKEDAKS